MIIINTVAASRINRCLALLFGCSLILGCESVGFYGQAVAGQLAMLAKRTPIEKLVTSDRLTAEQLSRFQLIDDILEFAATDLQLPVGKTFSSYVDLQRDYVVWNVFAAPAYSVDPHQWCYPIAGCANYRGYFSETKARSYASKLAARGYDTYIAGVKAYSTLGWFNDPILNTFFSHSDTRLAGLIFHELAHKVVYIAGDTDFNESFARAVEIEGVKRWLRARDAWHLFAAFQQRQQVHEQFVALVQALREKLQRAYREAASEVQKQAAKTRLFADFDAEFAAFALQHPEAQRYQFWVEQAANNAKLIPISSYNIWVPAFEAMLRQGFAGFFEECKALAGQDEERRNAFLRSRMAP